MSWSSPGYEAAIAVLSRRTGLSFPPQRQDSAENGVRRAMARAGLADLERYRALLESDAGALDDLIVELTVGETYFFREPAQFQFLRRVALPEVLARRGFQHGVRAWSAACASGEEAYSLAILFAEEGLAGRAYLLATDVSRAALARAREASYSNWSLRGEGAALAQPYLSQRDKLHVLHDKVRRAVTFEYLNLALDVYPSFATGTWGMDLILCRNVLIYFDRETVRDVARRLLASLAPGGWLLTASSDPPLGGDAPFETVVTDVGVFYRRAEDKVTAWQGDRVTEGAPPPLAAPSPAPPIPAPSVTPSPCHPVPLSPPHPVPLSPSLEEAREAFAQGHYARAADLARGLEGEAASALRVRALANVEMAPAERACAEAVARHPLSVELHHLHAVLLLALGRNEDAARAARRVIYLDRSLAIGHYTLGSILWQRGDLAGARRAYRNARDLCAARPPDEVVPLSDGERAGRLAEAAATLLEG